MENSVFDVNRRPSRFLVSAVRQTAVLKTKELDATAAMTRTGELIGKSTIMRDLRKLIADVAQSDATVLIQGETGTGKELVAEMLHQQSPRAACPLVKVNCAALPEALLEVELFGCVRGAFTDAIADRAGRFEAAHTGTILLDEIGDLSLPLQAKLLRAVENREFERVGSVETRLVDVRILAQPIMISRMKSRRERFAPTCSTGSM